MKNPPKPRLTLRVGIVGHRPDKLGTAGERIAAQLKEVFGAIGDAADAILKASQDCYAPDPPAVRLVSGFAQGADRLAVRLCPQDWQVEAILPFPRDKFATFSQEDAGAADAPKAFAEALNKATVVTELSPPEGADGHPHHGRADREARHREQGYADGGGYFLRQIDLLVAVWDGNPPKVAGTGAIARQAFEGGIPVVWISTKDENHPPRLIKGFDKHAISTTPGADATKGPLKEALESVLAAPSRATGDSRRSAGDRLRDFLQEDWRKSCYFLSYDFLKRVANRQLPRFTIRFDALEARSGEWDTFLENAPPVGNLIGRIREILLPRFVWADSLAVYFSHCYRSAYVLAYWLSAIAVALALGGLFAPSVDWKAAFVLAELLVITAIIGTVWCGRHWRWHERWLDYRALAESLRYGRFLSFISEFGHLQERSTGPESPWMLWYLRATMREVGLPGALIDGTYRWRLLNTTLTNEIAGQLEYHKANSKSMQKVDHLLHTLGVICFIATFIILCVFLIGYGADLALTYFGSTVSLREGPLVVFKSVIILFSAGLPALGAALAGIRVHGDFEASRERSDTMTETLCALETDYLSTKDRDVTLDETAELLIAATRAMSEDVSAWQEFYGRKRLMLPA